MLIIGLPSEISRAVTLEPELAWHRLPLASHGLAFEEHGAATADFTVIRLHGADREQIEASTGKEWSRIIVPGPEGIRAGAAIARSNAQAGVLTIVNVNNHYEGSAPLTIERFLDELGSTGEEEPPC